MSPAQTARTVRLAHQGLDDAYGVYLAQTLFIYALVGLGWKHLHNVVPWPLLIVAAVAIVSSPAAC